ncbi:uncharacterized protein LOC115667482 [Syzygium oleosum]|uniref:uncharacterized protein LOC115667482 n=1 Tax=Syzygium oleosum TaxID=219896 RepID=UPI0024B895C0|nr:uncharacterized protein LOC115667482 [Syzygium oleosum]XP_056159855.1 uncharacterized protein LOC115667482 [Syzygium oleosum]
MNKRNALHGLAIVLPLAPLSVYAYRFLQEKTSADWNYDVFLSFRGEDTHTGFTDFLYNSLVAAGVHVFRDDDALPVGEEIGPELLRAIRTCRIAIPIISEQYAQSEWCLKELTEIMECHTKHGKSVFPVFYKVDLFDVGHQRGSFGKALCEHRMRCSPEELAKWSAALTSVARIRGWLSQTIANGHEGDLVKMVVANVSSELKTTWIKRLPLYPILMSNDHLILLYLYFLEKKRESKWQVFLAFRSSDTRYGFGVYLYISLVAAGIRVFSDHDPSLIGTDVAHEILNAFDHCKISIPILSENYASSRWCLDDLAEMVERKRTKGQKVLPIFYKVKPSHVRDISYRFKADMLQHKEPFDGITYERWEQAPKKVGSFKGWESEKIANGHEGILVKRVVKEVSRMLKNPQTLDPTMPVQ